MPPESLNGLKSLFEPEAVAVVGVSKTPNKVGSMIFRNFKGSGFCGKVYPVNPKYDKVFGERCYPSVREIPGSLDLVVIAVPAPHVIDVMSDCVAKGVKAVIVVSGGFKESGPEGAALEEKLRRIAEGSGVRVLGPNCIGVYNPYSRVDTIFLPEERLARPKPGTLSFISQSGALAVAMLDWLALHGYGIGKCVSYGNGCDVDETDLLLYLAEDDDTDVILLYIEGVKDGRRFMEAAKRAVLRKPVVAIKAGRSATGASAIMSHTGSMAGSDEVYEAAFKQTGVIRVGDFEEAFDVVKAFTMQPLASGRRVLIVTNGGGAGIMAVDACERSGLTVPELDEDVKRRLPFPPHFSRRNPIDLTGDVKDEDYWTALNEAFLKYDGFDSALICILPQVPNLTFRVADIIGRANKVSGKPIVACCMGGAFTLKLTREIESRRIPVYPTPERAAKALSSLAVYKEALMRLKADLKEGEGRRLRER